MTGILAAATPAAHARIFGTDPLAISFNALSGTPNGPSAHPAVSGDNRKTRYAAFDSTATNLVAGDTNGQPDVFVHVSAVERAGMRSLVEGQKLSFDVVKDNRNGKSAAENLQAA